MWDPRQLEVRTYKRDNMLWVGSSSVYRFYKERVRCDEESDWYH